MNIQISDHFTYKKLIRFVLPSVGMMLFTSVYYVVDGYFVSNWAGKTPFAAINLIMPFLMIFSAVGFMFGTGGTALVAKFFGEGKREKALSSFSLLVYVLLGFGTAAGVLAQIFLPQVARLLGATEDLLPYCVQYGRIILLALPAFMLQNFFQNFMVTAEKPQLGFLFTVISGLTNMVGDFLLVFVFRFGVAGAAVATALSQLVGGLLPFLYFCSPNQSLLRLGGAQWDGKVLGKTCWNGSSEFLVNISLNLVGMLYNKQLMDLAGEDGVSAYGVIMYVCFLFIAVFCGYTVGVEPIVSYHFGAKNRVELKSIHRKGLVIVGVLSIGMLLCGELLAEPLGRLYVGYDKNLLEMTVRALRIYSLSYLLLGFSIYASAFFTALNDGTVSAVISFCRTLVFQVAAVLILPRIWALDGVWLANVFAEIFAILLSVSLLLAFGKKYGYR